LLLLLFLVAIVFLVVAVAVFVSFSVRCAMQVCVPRFPQFVPTHTVLLVSGVPGKTPRREMGS
jgi:hypothetical protein